MAPSFSSDLAPAPLPLQHRLYVAGEACLFSNSWRDRGKVKPNLDEILPSWYRASDCTFIRFVWVSAKFCICSVVNVNGTLKIVEAKTWTFTLNRHIFSSTSFSFTPTTVQVPNLTLTHTKRVTVRVNANDIVATVLGSIPAFSDTAESEGRQMKPC